MTDTSSSTTQSEPSNAPPPTPRVHEPASGSLRRTAHSLGLAIRFLQGSFLALGGLVTLQAILLANRAYALATLAQLMILGIVGVFIIGLLRAGATLIEAWAGRLDAAESAEVLVISALGRIAEALERPATVASVHHAAAPADSLAEINKAMDEARWEHADGLIREFIANHPGSPEGTRMAEALDSARAAESRTLHAKIAAAREVGDPDRVLELRDSLRHLLDEEGLLVLDQDLTRWLMALIQKRLRAGTIRVDVVELAAKVADRFDHISEGASLRAALPTLRRSAGLCARCGKPYTGIADACPACLTTQSFPTFGTEFDPEPNEDDEFDQVALPDEPL